MLAKQIDERRELIIPGNAESTIRFCALHFIACSQEAIKDHGYFYVALSGGSTPKALFEKLTSDSLKDLIDWKKFHLFWSDERSVGPENPDSNYHMAMEAGLKNMPIPQNQVHRMQAEAEIEKNALAYEKTIKDVLKGNPFDLITLGMGDDGHTASLFPHTKGLQTQNRLVIANEVPQHKTWRMTLTYDCINQAKNIAIYVIGAKKKEMLAKVLTSPFNPEELPIQKVGTPASPALYIADTESGALLS